MTQRIPGPGDGTSRTSSRRKRTWLSGRRRVILPIAAVALVLGSAGTALACVTPPGGGGGWPPITQPSTPPGPPECEPYEHNPFCQPTPPVTTPPVTTPPTDVPPTTTPPTTPPVTVPPTTPPVTVPPTTPSVTPSTPSTPGGGTGCGKKSSGSTCKVVTGTPSFTG